MDLSTRDYAGRRFSSPRGIADLPASFRAYLDGAITALRQIGHPVDDEDIARLCPYMRRYINVHGHYSFQQPPTGTRRALRDPDPEAFLA